MNETLDKTNMTLRDRLRAFVDSFGLPRLIIAAFLLMLYIAAPLVGAGFWMQISNTINRFSWNAVMVLAMVPMIHSGCGLNFGLPLGIISGLHSRRALRLASQQDQGRRDDDCHLCRLLVRILHVHDVAAAALPQPDHGLGLFRQGPENNDLSGRLL